MLRKMFGLLLGCISVAALADCENFEFVEVGAKPIKHIDIGEESSISLRHSATSSVVVPSSDIHKIVKSNMSEVTPYVATSKAHLLTALENQKPHTNIEFHTFLDSNEVYQASSEVVRSHMYVGLLRSIEWAMYEGKTNALIDGSSVSDSKLIIFQSQLQPSVRKIVFISRGVTLYENCGQI